MAIERTRLLDRRTQHRDAWLCVVVTEGERTEPQYFLGLQERGVLPRTRFKIEVIPPSPTQHDSAPNHVCQRADQAMQERRLVLGLDQVWLVLDVDRWGDAKLDEARKHARERGYGLAVSNPCFEVWLLLHHTDALEGADTAAECTRRLRQYLGSYSKAALQLDDFPAERVRQAAERARIRHPESSGWPQTPGSHVYRLIEPLLPPQLADPPSSR